VIAGTVIAEHVMTLRDAEKAASGSPSNSDQMVVLLVARPEINAISDLTGKGIAIDDRYSVSRDKVRTAIAAAGAAEIQLSEGQTKAIDRLIRGEVPAAVLTLLYPETGFPNSQDSRSFVSASAWLSDSAAQARGSERSPDERSDIRGS
jgi:hypothetical protein